ncbi:MAG: ferredoxin family protein [Firmicutes bacterium]|nr:ferredoxin family protein [Bacillota bacterium]
MPHVITAACIGTKDRACVDVCPVDCIHPYPEADGQAAFDATDQLYIDPETCIDCGACVPVCPVEAIYPDVDVPPEMEEYIQKNAEWYQKGS